MYRAEIHIEKGVMKVLFFEKDAPNTVANFVKIPGDLNSSFVTIAETQHTSTENTRVSGKYTRDLMLLMPFSKVTRLSKS